MDRITDACKNITLAKTSFRPVNMNYTQLMIRDNIGDNNIDIQMTSFSVVSFNGNKTRSYRYVYVVLFS